MSDQQYQWLTTAANPRTPATGFDAGQRGWRLHAIAADSNETFDAIRSRAAACGLRAAHGWSIDLHINEKCARCVAVVIRRGDQA